MQKERGENGLTCLFWPNMSPTQISLTFYATLKPYPILPSSLAVHTSILVNMI